MTCIRVLMAMGMGVFDCQQCGECCIVLWGSFEATHDDISRWRAEGRGDILGHIEIVNDHGNVSGIFTSKSCPFLRKNTAENRYVCMINDTKPEHCRNYPNDDVCLNIRNDDSEKEDDSRD